MPARTNSNTTSNTQAYRLPAFNLNTETITPEMFKWLVDGKLATYTPAAWGVLTYCIPRVHISVTKEFLATRLENYFADIYHNGVSRIQRIDIVPIEGNAHFVKAFVYHYQDTSYLNVAQMSLVSRITEDIFASEYNKQPKRVNVVHNGRPNFWLLLPNLNPLTPSQVETTERLTELSGELIDLLYSLASNNIAMPASFDVTVLDDKRVETAWVTLTEANQKLAAKENKLKKEVETLRAHAERHRCPTSDDLEAMDLLEYELDEEDAQAEYALSEAAADLVNPQRMWM